MVIVKEELVRGEVETYSYSFAKFSFSVPQPSHRGPGQRLKKQYG